MLFLFLGEDPYLYGKQRLWGSMGWGLFAIINGLLIDAVSTDGEEKNYAPAFYLMVPPLIIDFFISYRLKVSGFIGFENGRIEWKYVGRYWST